VKIVGYRPELAAAFRDLNLQWIRAHFAVEQIDLVQLSDPVACIVAPGGEVLTLLDDGRPVGCCAMIPAGERVYELAKMAVAPEFQGRGHGHRLLEAAIARARERRAAELTLISNTKLAPALHLYEAHGFRTTHLGPHPEYARGDVEMRLALDPAVPARGLTAADGARFEVLTFDCYGTLIDWEAGIRDALRPVLAARGVAIPDDELLARYAVAESAVERGNHIRYRDVLAEVTARLARDLGFEATAAERARLADSLADWRPFPDTVDALRVLAGRYQLAILSNIDDDLLAGRLRQLGVPLAFTITAAQVQSYKPAAAHFAAARARIGDAPGRWLHVAQSLYHDVGPARALGVPTVWVNRRAGLPGSGATPAATAVPDLEVADLAALARFAVAPAWRRSS
jgi:2-haloacid dehalogenase